MDTLVRTAVRTHRPTADATDPSSCRCGLSMANVTNARHQWSPEQVDAAQAEHRARYGDRD